MKTTQILKEMQEAFKTADNLFRQGNYESSIEYYNRALSFSQSLPNETTFDRQRFDASCYAGLSGALGRAGKHLESFAAANKALVFYDSFCENYPADVGRWLMAQVNQGTALAALRCLPAALEALQRAKDIFVNKGLDIVNNEEWLKMVDGNIEAIYTQIEKAKH